MSPVRRSLSWILLHLLVIGVTLTSLLTGFRIAVLSRSELLHFSSLLPQGYLHGIHILSGFGLIALTAVYLFYLAYIKERNRDGVNEYERLVVRFGQLSIFTALFSGASLYFGFSLPLAGVHYYSALGVLLFIFMHAGGAFVNYGTSTFIKIFHSAKPTVSDAIVLLPVAVLFALLYRTIDQSTAYDLKLHKIKPDIFIEIDGIANEKVWNAVQSVTLHTFGGANFMDGRTDVRIKALHNGSEAFFHISWDDPTESLQHLPLVKTKEGWRVMENGFYNFNEMDHYEDKFAVMLSTNCDPGGSGTAHLGPKPLKEKPANWHGRGYHYAEDGKVRDIWHWKAVRTNDMFTADDNFFGAPDVVRTGNRRYTAGYLPDGKESGAYVMNWQWYTPRGITPKRLPKIPEALIPFQKENGKRISWVIPWYSYDLYDKKNDIFPTGTIMPSVIYSSNRFEGDRADVRARAVWKNGRWSLELVRKLDTGSKLDVALHDGVCLWVAAFDHAQISHTRHARPLRIYLEKKP